MGKFFIDTEFFEDGKTIDLISIGVVAEDGREFYACSLDAQLHRIHAADKDGWMRDNVLAQLPPYDGAFWMSRPEIRRRLELFVHMDPDPKFWGYYSDYDWVAFCQLWGKMIELPSKWSKYCLDLKQYAVMLGNPKLPAKPAGAHNALTDARWNSDVYAFLKAIEENEKS
jgi:hypothetical protein